MSDSERGSLRRALDGIVDFFSWVKEMLESDVVREAVRTDMGWVEDQPIEIPQKQLDSIDRYRRNAEEPDDLAFLTTVDDILTILDAVGEVIAAARDLGEEEAVEELAHRFFNIFLLSYFRNHVPALYWVSQPLAFADEAIATYAKGENYAERLTNFFAAPWDYAMDVVAITLYPLRSLSETSVRYVIVGAVTAVLTRNWPLGIGAALLYRLLEDPERAAELKQRFDTEEGVREISHQLFNPIAFFLLLFHKSPRDWQGMDFLYGWDPADGSATPLSDRVAERTFSFNFDLVGRTFHCTAMLVPREHSDKGAGLVISLGGAETLELRLGEQWTLKVRLSSAAAVQFFFLGDDVEVEGPADYGVEILLEREADDVAGEKQKGTRFDWGPITCSGELSSDLVEFKFLAKDCALVIDAGDGDGFLSKILPAGETPIDFTFGCGVRKAREEEEYRFFLEGGSELEVLLPIGKSLGPLRLDSLYLSLAAATEEDGDEESGLEFEASATLTVKLGPFSATVERIGYGWHLGLPASGENLTLAEGSEGSATDFESGFQPPKGIAVKIGAEKISGGGYLFFDPDKGQYAGALQLRLFDFLDLKAVGLLSTRFPDGTLGYSLLVIISAEGFPPIQLPFGLTIIGVGGLVGLNRSAEVEVLRQGLKGENLDLILFPPDPMSNLPRLVSTLRGIFPPDEDRFLVGPMILLRWGFLRMKLGIVYERPAPRRLLVLGRIRLDLPRPERALVLLQMDALGVFELDRDEIAIDATLYDSRILSFALAGDMALRARGGDEDPMLLLSVGGFHPAFQPPPDLRKLERLAIDFTRGENPRLRLELYFAMTSNSLQFGAHLDFYVGAAGFSFEAYLGFDVLMDRATSAYEASIAGGVALKWHGKTLMGAHLEGILAGTAPCFTRGKVTFKVWIFSKSIPFNEPVSGEQAPALPPPSDPLPELLAALRDPRNWRAQLPGRGHMLVSLGEAEAGDGIVAHPLGELSVRQMVVPLGLEIALFRGTAPGGVRRFTIEEARVAGVPVAAEDTRPVEEHFAPGEYLEMNDDERLARPAFEKMQSGLAFATERVTYGGAVNAAEAARVELEYETITLGPGPPAPPVRHQPPAARVVAQAGLGAVSRAAAGRAGRHKYRAPARGLRLAAPAFVVASRDDLGAVAETAGGTTFTAAAEALERHLAIHPEERGRLQVVTRAEIEEVAP